MPRSAAVDPTRDRVLAAARAEFARYGIAGARIDRIAKAARTSKERVYAHFGSKEALYRTISAQELAAVAEATRLDPADLPGYAGRIHDHFAAHPERYRLMSWGQLELGTDDVPPDDAIRETMAHKVEQLRQVQQAGLLDPAWDPLDVLVLVHQIATSWAGQPGMERPDQVEFMAARRAVVITAVERLFPAAVPPESVGVVRR
ncbi:TetR/AcrR family transcriptional regulator [Kibdelosporangium aridum]|uniref:TetR/AcrR family transcriptional regulator n=1 Tax=Kibdelosporangium aridum TaxID=2030 RepID=A0A428Z129_KIBAR|nr:TetR family transcriptional regulator [Kibdelosporangium aridum]RSM78181.1 TetR/AcrR family transcriptional regulator [Kibdelosporangium aridum]